MTEEQSVAPVFNKKDAASLYKKVNELRADLMTRDWTDDKFLQIGSGGYRFLSTDKMLKTVSPLIAMHGLELRVEIKELQQRDALDRMPQHWTLRADVSLIDVDTGMADTSVVYAEAADNGDKALRKAHTMAIKQWILSKFLIADGIDELYETPEKRFKPKTEEEQQEAKSRVLSMGEKPSKPEPEEPKKTVKKKPSEPKEESKAEGEAPAPVEASKPAEKPAEAPATKSPENGSGVYVHGIEVNKFVAELSKPQFNMIEKAVEGKMQLRDAGAFGEDEYSMMLKHLGAIETKNDAMSFIRMYRE